MIATVQLQLHACMMLYTWYFMCFQLERAIITCESTFSHSLQNMHDPCTSQFYVYATYVHIFPIFLVCELRLVANAVL